MWGFLSLYRLLRRAWAKAFSLLASRSFAAFGRRSVIEPPVRVSGERRISIGDDVFIGAGSWLQVLEPGATLEIGNGTSIVGRCVLSSAARVRVGERVLMATGVYIADHSHAYGDPTRAVLDQGIENIAPVEIGDGAWLGENVVICPGVEIGRGAVVGANSVVKADVPPHSVAVGAPARVVRSPQPVRMARPG